MARRVLYSAFDVVPSPKGASTHVAQFVGGLTAGGYEVTLVTPRAPGLPEEERFQGARHLRVGTPGGGNFLARALEFGEETARIAETDGPFDIAHYRSFWSGLPLLLHQARHGYRTVFEANSLASVELPFHYPALRGHPTLERIRALELLTLTGSDAVLCVSKVSRGFFTSLGVPGARLHVIPNGVDPDRFAATPLRPLGNRVPVALYVGTLADWQGLSTLIAALPHILARHPLRLRIVGRGRSRQRKDLARRIRKLGLDEHVSVDAGVPHDEVPALIASADIALAPLSYNERNVVQGCCPLKVLEYAACGRPVVASNLPVVRELLREDRDALLVPPDAPLALATAVLRLLEDERLRARLSERGARRVRELFTWQRAQSHLLKIYEKLRTPVGRGQGSGVSPRRE
jgi:glycosyltransferase involved in cell wall biosynthesis